MTETTSPLDSNDTLAHALLYRSLGWQLVRIAPGGKEANLTGWKEQGLEEEELHNWWGTGAPFNIGIACGPRSGIVAIDIDPKDAGDEAWASIVAEYGPFPDTVEAITAGPLPGRHILYQYPDLPEGFRIGQKDLAPGINVRADGGYIVVAPSVHPDTGARYEWEASSRPGEEVVAPMPDAIARALVVPIASGDGERVEGAVDPTFAVDAFNLANDNETIARILEARGWHSRRTMRDGSFQLTRPGKRGGPSLSVGHVAPGVTYCFTSSVPELDGFTGYTPFGLYAALEHGGDRVAADAALVAQGRGHPTYAIDWAELETWAEEQHAKAVVVQAETSGLHIADALWDSHPIYAHIREAARSRLVAPDAVLASVLCRIAAATPHIVDIPAIVGAPVGLTYFAALVGPPETGKSAAAAVAAELLPVDRNKIRDRVPIGSGEGFVEILYGMVPDPENAKKQIRAQTHFAAIFHIDEGAVLTDIGARSGSTLLPTLRSAYTHGTLGNANASAERRRILRGTAYVYGVTMGIQPELAGPLLEDASGGTPQRFLWVQTTDPTAPDEPPRWPGALDWEPPPPQVLQQYEVGTRDGYRRVEMGFDPEIVAEVRADRRGVVRGTTTKTSMEAHGVLVRLKTAALLALAEQHMDVSLRHWELAGIVCETSAKSRQAIEVVLAASRQRSETATASRQARVQSHIASATDEVLLERAAAVVARAVQRHIDDRKHAGGCSERCFNQALGKRYRDMFSIEEVADEAVAREWIVGRNGTWEVGASRPSN